MNLNLYTLCKPYLAVALVLTGAFAAQAQVTVSGGSAAAGSYTTLALAAAALNANPATAAITVTFDAGHTEIAPVAGIQIGSAILNPSLSATNTLTISGPATLTAGVGTATPSGLGTHDGILALLGADYVTISGLTLMDGNTSNPATMEYGIGLFKLDAADGAHHNTIANCTITLNKINSVSGAGIGPHGATGIIVSNSTVAAPTTALSTTNGNSFNQISSNTIQNCNTGISLWGLSSVPTGNVAWGQLPSTFYGDVANKVGGTASTANFIYNFGGGVGATSDATGIRSNNQYDLTLSYNTINNNLGGSTGGAGGTTNLRGIFVESGNNANVNVDNNTIRVKSAATGFVTSYGVDFRITKSVLAVNSKVSISNNMMSDLGTTAVGSSSCYGIYNSTSPADTVHINGNTIQNIVHPTTGALYVIYALNNFSFYARKTLMNGNTVNNISKTSTSGTIYGVYTYYTLDLELSNNTVTNVTVSATGTSSGSIYGVYYPFSINQPGMSARINGNVVNNLQVSGTTTSNFNTIYGIFGSASATNSNHTFTGNTVSNLKINTGSGTLYAITSGGAFTSLVNRNKIFNLTVLGATPTLNGIYNTGTGTVRIENNTVGGLRTPNANTTSLTSFNGISLVNGSGTVYVEHNTILLNSNTSAGAAANYNPSCLYEVTGHTTILRNNILVNLSLPSGTGFAASHRRNNTNTSTFSPLSNNNVYYVSTAPTVGRYLFTDGTTSANTLSGVQTYWLSRESNSLNTTVNFASTSGSSPAFLHISTSIPTFIESAGTPIATITTDIDNEVRNATTPDIGADEFTGTQPPACSSAPNAGLVTVASPAICTAQTTQLLSNAANNVTGVSYQWVTSAAVTGPFENVIGGSGATTLAHVVANNLTPGNYFYVLKATCINTLDSALSNVVSVLVKPVPTAVLTSNAPVCLGGTLVLTGTSDVGNEFLLTGPGGLVATTTNYSIPNAQYTNGGGFTYKASLNGCTSLTSSTTALVSYAPPAPAILPATDIAACAGGTSGVLLFVNPVVPAASVVTGTGTSVNGYTGYPTPYGAWYGSTRTQYLITAAELISYGMVPGSALNGVSFDLVASDGTVPGAHANFTISLGATSATGLTTAAGWLNANNTVLGPISYTPTVGVNTHTFTSPFVWDGASNIVVQTCHVNGTPSTSGSTSTTYTANGRAKYTATTNASCMWRNTDGADNCNSGAINAPSSTSTNRANMTFSVSAPTVAYNWSPAATLNIPAGPSVIATPVGTTVYTVQALTSAGCSATQSKTITILDQVVISSSTTPVTCLGLTNGTATVSAVGGGAGAFTFLWSNDSTAASLSGLAAGTYTVTATSLSGCTGTLNVVVGANPSIEATAVVETNVSCFGGNNGSVTISVLGGLAPYTGIGLITGLSAGVQSLTATDVNGCQSIVTPTIIQPTVLATLPAATNLTCNANATGAVVSNVTGGTLPYTYAWSNAASTDNISGVAAGAYSVAVTDANGCSASGAITVTEPTVLEATISTDVDVLCNSAATGALMVSATGGTMPYAYLWSNAAETASISGLVAGSYVTTITDANGCTVSTGSTISEPMALALTAVATAPTCATGAYLGTSNGEVLVTAVGGVAPYAGAGVIADLTAGSYTYTVTDANGCSSTVAAEVAQGATNATYFADTDMDSYGDPLNTLLSCTGVPSGYQEDNLDCDDLTATTYPDAQEIANLIDDDCNGIVDDECLVVGNLVATNLTITSAKLSWTATQNLKKYIVQYRVLGTTTWIQVGTGLSTSSLSSPNSIDVTGLTAGTTYQYRVKTHCNSGFTDWSATALFTTLAAGCIAPVSDGNEFVSTTSQKVKWISNGATSYSVRYRELGSPSWVSKAVAGNLNYRILTGLAPGATYEYTLRSICGAVSSPLSAINTFTMASSTALMQQNNGVAAVEVNAIRVFPNPASNVLYVENLPADAVRVEVMNAVGATLLSVTPLRADAGLELIDLTDGLFYIIVKTEGGDRIAVPFVKTTK